MRLAEIVQTYRNTVSIPKEFQRTLGLSEGSRVCVREVVRTAHEPLQLIITTIPYESWRTCRRVSVQLQHRIGAMHEIAKALESHGASILLMEGYGRDPEREGWWSAVVDFPVLSERNAGETAAGRVPEAVTADEIATAVDKKARQVIEAILRAFEGDKGRISPPPTSPGIFDSHYLVWGESGRLRTLMSTRRQQPIAAIEPMRLNMLRECVRVPADDHTLGSQIFGNNRINIATELESRTPWHEGLLLSSTDSRFLRLVVIHSPVRIELVVEMNVKRSSVNTPGVFLADLTERLACFATSAGDKGINIVSTDSYITDRAVVAEGGTELIREVSRIRFYLEPPGIWRELPGVDVYLDNWKRVFKSLLGCEKQGEVAVRVKPTKSRMKVWHKTPYKYKGNAHGNVVPDDIGDRIFRVLLSWRLIVMLLLLAAGVLLLVRGRILDAVVTVIATVAIGSFADVVRRRRAES